MVSNGSVPWYNVPAREFPAKRWLRERYPFRVTIAPSPKPRLPGVPRQRPFPALVWVISLEKS